MKKIIRIAAMIVAVAAMTCILFACGDGANADLDKLNNRLTTLESQLSESKNSITDLENQVADLEEELAGKNVFWTEKAEYTEDETMTVYYGKTAVFNISLFKCEKQITIANGGFEITSLVCDIYETSIIQNSSIEWDTGTSINNTRYTDPDICKKGIPLQTWTNFNVPEEILDSTLFFNFIIPVPGTPFPLAKFTNITLEKWNIEY